MTQEHHLLATKRGSLVAEFQQDRDRFLAQAEHGPVPLEEADFTTRTCCEHQPHARVGPRHGWHDHPSWTLTSQCPHEAETREASQGSDRATTHENPAWHGITELPLDDDTLGLAVPWPSTSIPGEQFREYKQSLQPLAPQAARRYQQYR